MRARPWVSTVAIRGLGARQPSRLYTAVLLLLLAVFAAPGAQAADETSRVRAVVGAGVCAGHRAGRPLGAAHLVQREPVGPVGSGPGGGGALEPAAPGHLRRGVGAVHRRGGALHRRRAAVLQGPGWSGRHLPSLVGTPAARWRRSRRACHPWQHRTGGGRRWRVRIPALPGSRKAKGWSPSEWASSSASAHRPARLPSPRLSANGRNKPPTVQQAPSSRGAQAPRPRHR